MMDVLSLTANNRHFSPGVISPSKADFRDQSLHLYQSLAAEEDQPAFTVQQPVDSALLRLQRLKTAAVDCVVRCI